MLLNTVDKTHVKLRIIMQTVMLYIMHIDTCAECKSMVTASISDHNKILFHGEATVGGTAI